MKHQRDARFLFPQEFENIIIQVKEITKYIYLHVQGEPLSHPQFEEILSLCDQHEMKVQLVTNGTFLYKYPNLFSHACLRKVSFSLQSIEYQKKEKLSFYFKQLEYFIEQAAIKKFPYCELRFWRSDQYNLTTTRQYIDYLKEKYQFLPTKRKNSFQILHNVYIDFDNSFEWPEKQDTYNFEQVYGTCHGAIHQIAILSNGEVVPCCLDYNGIVSFGNIFDTNLKEILKSNRYLEIVKGFQENKVIEPYCQHCSFRKRFD